MLAAAFLPGVACNGDPGGYLEHVSKALTKIESNHTQEAVADLHDAMTRNANHPLAHAVLGYALFAGGRASDAVPEFDAALTTDGNCAAALYGKGLVSLKKNQVGQAVSYLRQAQSADPGQDMSAAIEYAKGEPHPIPLLGGEGACDTDSRHVVAADEARMALEALAAMKEKRFIDAATVWEKLQDKAARPGFGERLGCSMSFLASDPIVIGGTPMKGTYKPFIAQKSKIKTVKGTVSLQADVSRARDIAMVSFFVDEVLLGITNCVPSQCSWDTTRYRNGPHTVRIAGTDSLGVMVSEKTTRVMVSNPGQDTRPVVDDDSLPSWNRLWKLMTLKPSATAINYNLALCYLQMNQEEKAAAALERVMAANPGYRDTRERLRKLYAIAGSPGTLTSVKTSTKALALTFDDGPKADTIKLLDALKAKGVRATFFVVGTQVEKFPEILKRMCDEGHEIQNHTYNHRALEYLSTTEIEQELFKNVAVVRAITGRRMPMVRPPGARRGTKYDEVARKYGLRTVMYSANCVSLEGTTPERVRKYTLSSAKPGAVILMHNLDRVTLAALPEVIDTLKDKGYRFSTLSELLTYARAAK